jgi:tRNA 2-thiouridine synthesizing protein E
MEYDTNKDGFLLDLSQWDKSFAEQSAKSECIDLTEDHWEVIYFVRDFYKEYETSPAIRALIKALKHSKNDDKWNSLFLQSLFPESPAVQAAKIAGIPKPVKCI